MDKRFLGGAIVFFSVAGGEFGKIRIVSAHPSMFHKTEAGKKSIHMQRTSQIACCSLLFEKHIQSGSHYIDNLAVRSSCVILK